MLEDPTLSAYFRVLGFETTDADTRLHDWFDPTTKSKEERFKLSAVTSLRTCSSSSWMLMTPTQLACRMQRLQGTLAFRFKCRQEFLDGCARLKGPARNMDVHAILAASWQLCTISLRCVCNAVPPQECRRIRKAPLGLRDSMLSAWPSWHVTARAV